MHESLLLVHLWHLHSSHYCDSALSLLTKHFPIFVYYPRCISFMGVGPCLTHTIPFSYSAYIAQGPTTCWYNIHKLLPIFWHSGHSLVLASVCQLPMNIFFSTNSGCLAQFLPSSACSLELHICGRPQGFCRNRIMSACDFRKDTEWEPCQIMCDKILHFIDKSTNIYYFLVPKQTIFVSKYSTSTPCHKLSSSFPIKISVSLVFSFRWLS